jgi:hypothetical protein
MLRPPKPPIEIRKLGNFVFTTNVDTLLNKAKKEIIVIGGPMTQITGNLLKILGKTNLKIRLLALDIRNPDVSKTFYEMTQFKLEIPDLHHLKPFINKEHIEVRLYTTPPTAYFIATDLNENEGLINAAHIFARTPELDYLHLEIRRSNSEWYGHYRSHIEALWESGVPYKGC